MTEKKVDRLFVRSNCVECAKVRGQLNFTAVVDDEFRGFHGEELRVFSALSENAAKELLEKYGIAGHDVPVVLTHDGAVVAKAKNVISHLRRSGML